MDYTRRTPALLPTLLLIATAALGPRLGAQWYTVTYSATWGGTGCQAFALNNAGTVVGTADLGGQYQAISYAGGVLTNLGAPAGGSGTEALAINAGGTIAGDSEIGGILQLFSSSGGINTTLGNPPAAIDVYPAGINDSGEIAGTFYASGSPGYAFTYANGTFTRLADLAGTTGVLVTGINNAGTVAATAEIGGQEYAVTYTSGTAANLGWGPDSYAYGINNAGTVAGVAVINGLLRGVTATNGVLTDLGTFPGGSTTQARAINNAGAVVGSGYTAGMATHAFVSFGGPLRDLNTLVNVPGTTLGTAFAINDQGQILAQGTTTADTYLLTPVTIHFSVSAPASATAGTAVTVTVTALDPADNLIPFYNGTANLTSSDSAALLPVSATLNGGTISFEATLQTPGTATFTATDSATPSITGHSAAVAVALPLGAASILQEPGSLAVSPGSAAAFSVSAAGNPAPTYQWYFNGAAIPGATSSSFSIGATAVANSGSYTVILTNSIGRVTSAPAFLTVTAASGGPGISSEPAPAELYSGETVVLAVGGPGGAAGSSAPGPRETPGYSYQWYRDGSPLADGTGITGSGSDHLVLTGGGTRAGAYACLVTNAVGSLLSQAALLTVSATAEPGHLINVSCRANVGTGANILIAGFVVGGAGTAGTDPVLVRGSGPALVPFGVIGVLADPELALYGTSGGSTLLASNSGWAGSSSLAAAASAVGAFAWANPQSNDAALLQNLEPGAYTANVSGRTADTGVALAEVYDATPAASFTANSPRLINVSTRVVVGTGGNVLIAGFVIGGNTSKTVLIRASGPALAPFGVAGTLPDPKLQLGTSLTVLATNDGWGGDPAIAATAAAVGAFSWGAAATADSALLVTLSPGAYTAQVSGATGDTGVALVEIYDVP